MNKDFLDDWFEDVNGNRYKGLGFGAFGSDPNRYKGQRLMTTPRPDSYIDLGKAIGRINLTGARHEAEVPIGIDVDAMHRYFACNAFLTVSDTFPRHNFYMYVDPYHNQFSVLPWDVNYSWRTTNPVYNSYWLRGVSSSVWNLRYQAHLRNIAEELDLTEFRKWIADYHKLCLAEMKKETMWFYSTANLVTEANRIITLATTLRANVLRTLGATPVKFSAHTRTPLQPDPKNTVWVSVKMQSTASIKKALLHYRSRGYFKETAMFDDGKHRDGLANDGVYGISIPPGLHRQFDYYFSATLSNAVAFHPSRAAANAYSYSSFKVDRTGPLISEFLASNTMGLKDEKGEREDWIEIFNPTNAKIDITGMYLSDDIENLKMWKIPVLIMNPGERVLIWADNETNEGPFHAGFKLALDEDAVYLTDRDGVTLRDFIEYENQIPDISTGRLFDKISTFVTLKPPTPLQPNELISCGSRLFAAPDQGATSIQLGFVGTPRTNSKVSFEFLGASPNGTFLMMLGLAPDSFLFPQLGVQLHISGPLLTAIPVTGNAIGAASVPMTVLNDPRLDGFHLTFQALSVKDKVVVASNGLELRFCK
jgi:Lamin Tail Domain/CotH kinase protein